MAFSRFLRISWAGASFSAHFCQEPPCAKSSACTVSATNLGIGVGRVFASRSAGALGVTAACASAPGARTKNTLYVALPWGLPRSTKVGEANERPPSSAWMAGSVCSSGHLGPGGSKSVLKDGYQYDDSWFAHAFTSEGDSNGST